VFLDEPTSGLDPLGRLLVRDIIGELRQRGTTVFLNSHLLGEVEATCDRVAFIKEGRVIHALTLAGANANVEVELKLAPIDAGVVAGLMVFGSSPVRLGDEILRLHVTGEDRIPEMVRWLVERGVAVFGVHVHRKSLEEWFVDVMGEDQRPG